MSPDLTEACQCCARFIQTVVQQPDCTYRPTKHGICGAQSTFNENDTTPGIPPDAKRVPNHEVAHKKMVWGKHVILCTLRVKKNA